MNFNLYKKIAYLSAIIGLLHSLTFAEGISRSTGIGLRAGFWNISGQSSSLRLSVNGGGSQVSVNGTGMYLYFFSRLYNNWFYEINFGAIGNVQVQSQAENVQTHISSIVPLLFGLRCDLFSTRLSGPVHPFISAGGGPYWTGSEQVDTVNQPGNVLVESNVNYGWYVGAGTNILLTSWVGLNFDLKYHVVDFKKNQEFDSGLEFGMGLCFMWGSKREIFQIKDVKLVVQDIYPAYYQFYNTYPLALVSVKNLVGHPIEVSVRCTVKGYSEKPKDSEFIQIDGGRTRDIPVTAFLGKDIYNVSQRDAAIMDLVITARSGVTVTKQYSTQLLIHGHNAWNGDMSMLPFFITADDERILALSRDIMESGTEAGQTRTNFDIARTILDKLQEREIRYQPDPNVPFYQDDRVQFAWETWELGTGDCDDLSVLYATLLQSLGIQTAFVEVRDPLKDIAHLYVMLNTGLSPEQGYLISSNEKRYIQRDTASKQQTLWIPVETTLIASGFETAWTTAAMNYLQEGVIRNGLTEGWVKIIDVK
jgi:hypothetical protein